MNTVMEMKESELQEINGGVGVVEVLGLVLAVYVAVREGVKEQGKADAYEDLGIQYK